MAVKVLGPQDDKLNETAMQFALKRYEKDLETRKRANERDLQNWKEKVERSDLPAIPFVVPYCQTGTQAGKIIKQYYSKIKDEYEWVYEHKPITAFTRHANLKDLLVSTKLR